MEHLLLPVLRRRQLGRRQRKEPAIAADDALLPQVNLFCYGQVESPYGSGEFIRSLEQGVYDGRRKTGRSPEIENKEAIYDSIKRFLGKGKPKSTDPANGLLATLPHGRTCATPPSIRTAAHQSDVADIQAEIEEGCATTGSISSRRSSRWSTPTSSTRSPPTAAFPPAIRTGGSAWSTSSSPRATPTGCKRSTSW